MKRAIRPRYWKTRRAYYCWKDKQQYLLAKGEENDPTTLKVAWESYWRLYQTPVSRRLETIDWKQAAAYYWDVLPNPVFAATFPPEQHRTQAAWSILAWLNDFGRATDEQIPERLKRAGLDVEFLSYLVAAFGKDKNLRTITSTESSTATPAE